VRLGTAKPRWQNVDSRVGVVITHSADDKATAARRCGGAISSPSAWGGTTEDLGSVVARGSSKRKGSGLVLEVVEPVTKLFDSRREKFEQSDCERECKVGKLSSMGQCSAERYGVQNGCGLPAGASPTDDRYTLIWNVTRATLGYLDSQCFCYFCGLFHVVVRRYVTQECSCPTELQSQATT
jgi:hypothetical protein